MMCQDVPGQPPRKRIAVCACNQDFPDCDVQDALNHITEHCSSAHYWVYLDRNVPEFSNLLLEKPGVLKEYHWRRSTFYL